MKNSIRSVEHIGDELILGGYDQELRVIKADTGI